MNLLVLSLTMFISFSFSLFESKPKNFDEMAKKMAQKFEVETIEHDQINKKLKNKNIIYLDAREKNEFDISHIKDAINIGFDDFDYDKIKSQLDKESSIIIYCSVGYRSGKIGQELKRRGYKVYNLYGGLFNWVNQGLAIYKNNEKTPRIHGYNKEWGKWLEVKDIVYND